MTASHAYPLTGSGGDWLERFTGLVSFGRLAVNAFFIISGFLIAQSYDRSKRISLFLWSRALRVYPGFFSLVLTVLMGPIMSDRGFLLFLHDPEVIGYLKDNLLFNPHFFN